MSRPECPTGWDGTPARTRQCQQALQPKRSDRFLVAVVEWCIKKPCLNNFPSVPQVAGQLFALPRTNRWFRRLFVGALVGILHVSVARQNPVKGQDPPGVARKTSMNTTFAGFAARRQAGPVPPRHPPEKAGKGCFET